MSLSMENTFKHTATAMKMNIMQNIGKLDIDDIYSIKGHQQDTLYITTANEACLLKERDICEALMERPMGYRY